MGRPSCLCCFMLHSHKYTAMRYRVHIFEFKWEANIGFATIDHKAKYYSKHVSFRNAKQVLIFDFCLLIQVSKHNRRDEHPICVS